jgi:hypothetical protein
MSVTALLTEVMDPIDRDIDQAMSGNSCLAGKLKQCQRLQRVCRYQCNTHIAATIAIIAGITLPSASPQNQIPLRPCYGPSYGPSYTKHRQTFCGCVARGDLGAPVSGSIEMRT